MPGPVQNNDEKQKVIKYYNIQGGYVIETTYNPNTNTYKTHRFPFNVPASMQ